MFVQHCTHHKHLHGSCGRTHTAHTNLTQGVGFAQWPTEKPLFRSSEGARGEEISAFIPLYANEFIATVSDSWMLSGLCGAQAKDAEPAAPGEHSHWRPHAFILVTTGKPQHCAHRTAPSRLASPVLRLLCRWTDIRKCFMSY